MIIAQSPASIRSCVERLRQKNRTVGFVPTMGSLHAGHLSLIRLARRQNDAVVASLFVNPMQFGPREDYRRYPRDPGRDRRLLEAAKTDVLFFPAVSTMYPDGFRTRVSVESLAEPLCGASRPGHFTGVATVVLKLLNLVRPDTLYLGQKDYQQYRLIRQMVRDLDLEVKVRMAPIVRERDGLAMSSRNVFLTPAERRRAARISAALRGFAKDVSSGVLSVTVLKKRFKKRLLETAPSRLDYAEIVDADTLQPVVKLRPGDRLLAAVAVYFSKTRLIDNALIRV